MKTAYEYGLTPEAVALARDLCTEAGLDTMTDDTWPDGSNQLWGDAITTVWHDDLTEIDAYNAAAAGDVAAVLFLRSLYHLPIFS